MTRHRHLLRRWAAQLLLLWLFALGCGVAHACLGRGAPAQAAAVAVDDAPHGPCHGAPAAEQPSARSNCDDFCTKAGAALPKSSAALDDAAAAAPPCLAAPLFAPPLQLRQAADLPPARSDARPAPPIPIAFLRLAL